MAVVPMRSVLPKIKKSWIEPSDEYSIDAILPYRDIWLLRDSKKVFVLTFVSSHFYAGPVYTVPVAGDFADGFFHSNYPFS